jgi:hypothetical protein
MGETKLPATGPDPSGDALLGNCATARNSDTLSDAILALCATANLAKHAEELTEKWAPGIFKNPGQGSLTRGAAALGLGNSAKAIELLRGEHSMSEPIRSRITFAGWRI